jgi:hypothetical protein
MLTTEGKELPLPERTIRTSIKLICDYFRTTHGFSMTKAQAVDVALYHWTTILPRINIASILGAAAAQLEAGTGAVGRIAWYTPPIRVFKILDDFAEKHNIASKDLAILGIIYVARSFAECTDDISKIHKLVRIKGEKR